MPAVIGGSDAFLYQAEVEAGSASDARRFFVHLVPNPANRAPGMWMAVGPTLASGGLE
jgi:hypothetical protein